MDQRPSSVIEKRVGMVLSHMQSPQVRASLQKRWYEEINTILNVLFNSHLIILSEAEMMTLGDHLR